jgi:peroxiredoxin
MIERGETAPDATFVIDAGGRVADVIPKVSPKTHDEQVLKILRSM